MRPPPDTTLSTARLMLRPTVVGDARRFLEIQSNWNVLRMLRMADYLPTLGRVAAWLAKHRDERARGAAYRFSVLEQDRVVGCVDIAEIDGAQGNLGYWLDEAVWGRGLANEVATAARDFAFGVLGLTALRSGHAADNTASGKVLVNLGFEHVADETRWSNPRAAEIQQRVYRLERPPV